MLSVLLLFYVIHCHYTTLITNKKSSLPKSHIPNVGDFGRDVIGLLPSMWALYGHNLLLFLLESGIDSL